MSKYKCDCGGQLEFREEKNYQKIRRLLPNGKLSKKERLRDSGIDGCDWLQCIVCNKEYEIEQTNNGNWCKGEERI